ncbi:hypothetical protein HDU92_006205, partial [Lobulomyces angularis]
MLLRYYGLIPLVQWIIHSEKNPPKRLNRLQNGANLLYYPLEHIYWLAAHEVIPLSEEMKNKIGMWSTRFWASYVVLYFAQLYIDNEELKTRECMLKSRALEKGKSDAGSTDITFTKDRLNLIEERR